MVGEIKCACIRLDARDCIQARYSRRCDDCADDTGWGGDECECSCHDEWRQDDDDY